jgi:putative signal transducing protein
VKQIFTAEHGAEAHFVRGLLESRGVSAQVRGEELWGVRGEVPLTEAVPTVWILDGTREMEARGIIAEYAASRRGSDHSQPLWSCPTCGGGLEEQFTECWKCGTSR